MAGDEETGVSVMQVVAGLDSGPLALQERLPIEPGEDYGALSARLVQIGAELLVRAIGLDAAGALQLTEQDDAEATYAEKIERSERRLDPGLPAADLARRVQALNPHIGAYVDLDGGTRLGVRAARAEQAELSPGHFDARDGALLLGCSPGALALEVVQPPGGKPMPVDAFLRGHSAPARAAIA
jgi:methionyl-tRNA formyltransferase